MVFLQSQSLLSLVIVSLIESAIFTHSPCLHILIGIVSEISIPTISQTNANLVKCFAISCALDQMFCISRRLLFQIVYFLSNLVTEFIKQKMYIIAAIQSVHFQSLKKYAIGPKSYNTACVPFSTSQVSLQESCIHCLVASFNFYIIYHVKSDALVVRWTSPLFLSSKKVYSWQYS